MALAAARPTPPAAVLHHRAQQTDVGMQRTLLSTPLRLPGAAALPPPPCRCRRAPAHRTAVVPQAARGGAAAAKAAAAAAAAAAAQQQTLVSQLFAASTVYALAVAALVRWVGDFRRTLVQPHQYNSVAAVYRQLQPPTLCFPLHCRWCLRLGGTAPAACCARRSCWPRWRLSTACCWPGRGSQTPSPSSCRAAGRRASRVGPWEGVCGWRRLPALAASPHRRLRQGRLGGLVDAAAHPACSNAPCHYSTVGWLSRHVRTDAAPAAPPPNQRRRLQPAVHALAACHLHSCCCLLSSLQFLPPLRPTQAASTRSSCPRCPASARSSRAGSPLHRCGCTCWRSTCLRREKCTWKVSWGLARNCDVLAAVCSS